jgi:hypothetical protein
MSVRTAAVAPPEVIVTLTASIFERIWPTALTLFMIATTLSWWILLGYGLVALIG